MDKAQLHPPPGISAEPSPGRARPETPFSVRRRFSLDLARPSQRSLLGYLLLLPATLLIAAIVAYPLFVSLDLSFQNVNMVRLGDPHRPFTLTNYERLVGSDEFWLSCWVTLKFLV